MWLILLLGVFLLAGCGTPKTESSNFRIYIFEPTSPAIAPLAQELELPLDPSASQPVSSTVPFATRVQQLDLQQAAHVIDESMIQAYDWTHQVITLTNPLAPNDSATLNTRGVFVLMVGEQRFLVGNIVSPMAASTVDTPVLEYQDTSRLNNHATIQYKLRASSYDIADDRASLADIIGNAELAQQIHDHFKALGKLVE